MARYRIMSWHTEHEPITVSKIRLENLEYHKASIDN